MPPYLGGFFMVRSYYPSECHADYFDFERIEALKPAIESFFFQAEDGIRDTSVTGVQTCCSSDLAGLRLRQQVRQDRPALPGGGGPHPHDGRRPAVRLRRHLENDQPAPYRVH